MLIGYAWHRPLDVADSSASTEATASDAGFVPRLRAWLAVVTAVGVVEALYGTYQVVARHPQIYWLRKTAYLEFATGTFVNRNHLAGYFELAIPITFVLALGYIPWQRRRRSHRRAQAEVPVRRADTVLGMLCLAAIGAMVLAMGLTQSRGGVLSSLGSLGAGALAFGLWQRRLTGRRVVIGAAVLAGLAMLWLQSPELLARFGSGLRLTPYSRPSVWRETAMIARDFPLFGVGLGNFEFVFPRYQPEGTHTYFEMAHNDYLQLLVETGILGAACFSWLFWMLARVVVRNLREAAPERGLLALGLTTSLIALLLHSFTDFNLRIPSNALLFVIAFGATVRLLDRGSGSGLQGWMPLRSSLPAYAIVVTAGFAALVSVRNWWAATAAASIFPNTSLINPLAAPPDPLPARVDRVAAALRFAGGRADLTEIIGWEARQQALEAMPTPARHAEATVAWLAAVRAYRRLIELRPSLGYGDLRLGEAVANLCELHDGPMLRRDVAAQVVALFDKVAELQPRDLILNRPIIEWALAHWGALAPDDRARAAAWVRAGLEQDPLRAREWLRAAIKWDDPVVPLQLLPEDKTVRLYLALAYDDAGRHEDAKRVAAALEDELRVIVPKSTARYADAQLLGRVREYRGDHKGAAEAYARASVLADDDGARAEALKRSGYNWLDANEAERALQSLTAARRYGGRDPEVLAGLSAVHELRGDFNAAARLVKDAIAVASDAAPYRYRLAGIYERARDFGRANEQYRKLLDDSTGEFVAAHRGDILLGLARNYRQLEMGSEARRYYDLVLQQDPGNHEAKEFLAYFGS